MVARPAARASAIKVIVKAIEHYVAGTDGREAAESDLQGGGNVGDAQEQATPTAIVEQLVAVDSLPDVVVD